MVRIKDHLLSTTVLRITASLCLVILLGLHYKLISGSYEVKSNELFRVEKENIKRIYESSVINDKLFPGGQKIIDSYLSSDKIKELERLKLLDERIYQSEWDKVFKELLASLQRENNVDSLMSSIFKELDIKRSSVDYTLVIHTLLLTFDGKHYIPFVNKLSDADDVSVVAGNANILRPSNRVSTISVSTALPFTYRIGFALYVEKERAAWDTFVAILPLLLLSSVSILLMVFVYFFTFHNWIKQKKMNEIISDFVNSVTHEYKTPISTIKVCVKNLRRGLEAKEKEDNTQLIAGLSIIERQSDRLNKLIDQVIHVSIFDPKRMEKNLRPIVKDLKTILDDLRLQYQQHEHIQIRYRLPENEYDVIYTPFLFTTAINNLVQNAVKYNNSKDIVVDVELKEEVGKIVLCISDNGIGIAVEDVDHVFDRFYQSKVSRNRGGIGLGLYYVKQLVVTHGWEISVKSKLNGGTVFTIFMPTSKNSPV